MRAAACLGARIGGPWPRTPDRADPATFATRQFLYSLNNAAGVGPDFTGASGGTDSGAEIVRFIPARESPTRTPLLVVSNEISGTVSLWPLSLQ